MQSQQANDNANSATIHIGSKNFTEQFILGELMALLLENSREFTVVRHFNLGGTMVCHQALINDEIDIYAEYTGTALVSVLGKEVIHSATEAYQTVNSTYQDQYNLTWLAPFGFNNTYVLTVRDDFAKKNNLEAIKDIQDIDHTMSAGFTSEFMERDDGYPGMKEAYNLNFMSVRNLEPSLLYRAIAQENVDVICAFATDGRIAAYNLKPLEDNQSFFPPYYAAPVIRKEIIKSYPQLRTILNQLSGLLPDKTMQQLNYEVDENKRDPKAVAAEFLRKHNLINP
jgi:glycine betaine/choline ABC-type transport system substrate-binding protein